MNSKAEARRDAFAFSRGGLTVIASFVAAPVIASDRINRARDEYLRRSRAADRGQDKPDCHPDRTAVAQTA